MSRSASIDLHLHSKTKEPLSANVVFSALFKAGWNFENMEYPFYLDVGDLDYDWSSMNISKKAMFKLFEKKESLNETIGISLTWEHSNTGGEFLLFPDKTLSICITICRKMIEGCETTDFSWYLSKLITPLESAQIMIESLDCIEHP